MHHFFLGYQALDKSFLPNSVSHYYEHFTKGAHIYPLTLHHNNKQIKLHFLVLPFELICIKDLRMLQYQHGIIFYDGPGDKSSRIGVAWNRHHLSCSTSYGACLMASLNSENFNVSNNGIEYRIKGASYSPKSFWSQKHNAIRSSNKSVTYKAEPYNHIDSFEFQGASKHSQYFTSHCQNGGLFAYCKAGQMLFSFCSPSGRLKNVNLMHKMTTLYLIAFPGYSSFSAELSRRSRCKDIRGEDFKDINTKDFLWGIEFTSKLFCWELHIFDDNTGDNNLKTFSILELYHASINIDIEMQIVLLREHKKAQLPW